MIPCYVMPTPLGTARIHVEDDCVTSLSIDSSPVLQDGLDCPRSIQFLWHRIERELTEYFAGTRRTFGFRTYGRGSPFSRKVWAAISEIPYGDCVSYHSLALKLGMGRGGIDRVRLAVAANPIAIAIPCHRVRHIDEGNISASFKHRQALLQLEHSHLISDTKAEASRRSQI
jgi:methylated-DNA-[protein]-cysteine S-methyltransferase